MRGADAKTWEVSKTRQIRGMGKPARESYWTYGERDGGAP